MIAPRSPRTPPPCRRPLAAALTLAAVLTVAATVRSDDPPSTAPRSNLDHWLGGAATASGEPAPATAASAPTREPGPDALPGALVLSDGSVVAGRISTTLDAAWVVWVEAQQRWRHIPPAAVLSIAAVVVEEGLDKEWRWKEMGSDEKVFTGRQKPIRRFLWAFRIADGTTITGAVKGQPLWVDGPTGRAGPFLLAERASGQYGQSLSDLRYVRQVVFSRRAMEAAASRPAEAEPAETPTSR